MIGPDEPVRPVLLRGADGNYHGSLASLRGPHPRGSFGFVGDNRGHANVGKERRNQGQHSLEEYGTGGEGLKLGVVVKATPPPSRTPTPTPTSPTPTPTITNHRQHTAQDNCNYLTTQQ